MRRGRNIVLFSALATTGLAVGIFVSGRGPSASALLAGALSGQGERGADRR